MMGLAPGILFLLIFIIEEGWVPEYVGVVALYSAALVLGLATGSLLTIVVAPVSTSPALIVWQNTPDRGPVGN